MFHDKVGIFYDESGNAVGFRGSMNETFNGLSSDGNIESIDVFPNWMDDRDRERVENAQEFFDKLWGHELPGIIVYPFPSASKELLRHKSEGIEWEQLLEEIKVTETVSDKWRPNHQRVERCQGSTRRTLLRLGYKTGEGVYLNMQQVVVRPSLQCVQSMTP